MADISKVRSAYAFFQGKRSPVGGEKAVATVPVQPQPAQPTLGKDQFSSVDKLIAELERRIGQLETALKQAKAQQGTVATPPINPVPATPGNTQVDKTIANVNQGIAQVTSEINKAESQIAGEIDKFTVQMNNGVAQVNQVVGQIGQVAQTIQTQVPALTNQINQTVKAFEGVFNSFKNIKF